MGRLIELARQVSDEELIDREDLEYYVMHFAARFRIRISVKNKFDARQARVELSELELAKLEDPKEKVRAWVRAVADLIGGQ